MIIQLQKFILLFWEHTRPVGWDCKIHRFYLCRGVRYSQRVSCLWHLTIWWWSFSDAGALGNAEYSFITIAPKFTLSVVVTLDRVLFMGQIELNYVLMLNWIVLNRTVLTFELCVSKKLYLYLERRIRRSNPFQGY